MLSLIIIVTLQIVSFANGDIKVCLKMLSAGSWPSRHDLAKAHGHIMLLKFK